MPIDLSELSKEKQAFLKVSGLGKSIEEEVPRQVEKIKQRKKKREKGLSKLQRDLLDIDNVTGKARYEAGQARKKGKQLRKQSEMRRHSIKKLRKNVMGENKEMLNQIGRDHAEVMEELKNRRVLAEITRKLREHAEVTPIGDNQLICPNCGETNKGNTVNGVLSCLKCNVKLIPKKKVKKWIKIKAAPKNLKDEFKRRGLDF